MEKFYPQHAEEFSALLEDLKSKKVAVISHLRPDGDCIGAQVAFCRLLHHLGIEAVAINPDPVPRILESFLGGTPILLEEGKKSIIADGICTFLHSRRLLLIFFHPPAGYLSFRGYGAATYSS